MNTLELIEQVKRDFRFVYVGGGHFRDKNIPKGTDADTVHGDQIVEEFVKQLILKASQNALK